MTQSPDFAWVAFGISGAAGFWLVMAAPAFPVRLPFGVPSMVGSWFLRSHVFAEAYAAWLGKRFMAVRTDIRQTMRVQLFGTVISLPLVFLASPWLWAVVFCSSVALPLYRLSERRRKMCSRLLCELPVFFDLLAAGMDAGLDFRSALARVMARNRPGPLRDIMDGFQSELRLGQTLESSLERLALSAPGPLSQAASSLVFCVRMGSSMAPLMKNIARQARAERWHAAEKSAAQLPVRMLFPLVFLILPAVFIVLLGPLFLNLRQQEILF